MLQRNVGCACALTAESQLLRQPQATSWPYATCSPVNTPALIAPPHTFPVPLLSFYHLFSSSFIFLSLTEGGGGWQEV